MADKSKNDEKTTRRKIYDDVFKTMAQKMPRLLVPVINEVFGTNYSEDVKIDQSRNEYLEVNGEIITDAIVGIEGKTYHIESQSYEDDSMCIRMFEYDTAIATEQFRDTAKALKAGETRGRAEVSDSVQDVGINKSSIVQTYGASDFIESIEGFEDDNDLGGPESGDDVGDICDNVKILDINYPQSCVIYVRPMRNTPDRLRVRVNFFGGDSAFYETKVVKIDSYSMEDMFSKKLLMFLPFYILRYEKSLRSISKDNEKTKALIEECKKLHDKLEEATEDNREGLYNDLLVLINGIAEHMLRNYEELKKGVGEAMGGKVLELPSDKLKRERAAGLAEGRASGLADGHASGLAEGHASGLTEGKESNQLNNLRTLMRKQHLTSIQAMDLLDVPEEDRDRYQGLLEKAGA